MWGRGGIRPETDKLIGDSDGFIVRRDDGMQPPGVFPRCAGRQAVASKKVKDARQKQEQKVRFIERGKGDKYRVE